MKFVVEGFPPGVFEGKHTVVVEVSWLRPFSEAQILTARRFITNLEHGTLQHSPKTISRRFKTSKISSKDKYVDRQQDYKTTREDTGRRTYIPSFEQVRSAITDRGWRDRVEVNVQRSDGIESLERWNKRQWKWPRRLYTCPSSSKSHNVSTVEERERIPMLALEAHTENR